MFDVEKFIALVEERPALYDPRVQDYGSREIKSRCWWEIGSQVCDDWDSLNVREKYDKEKELMRKWKAIRDNFVKDIRHRKKLMKGEGVPKRRRYIYYSAMQFLLPILDDSEGYEQSTTDKKVDREIRNRTRGRQIKIKISADTSPTTTLNHNDVPLKEEAVIKEESKDAIETPSIIDNINNTNTNHTSISNICHSINASKNILQSERARDIFGNRAFLLSYLPIMDDLPSDLALEARLRITEVFKNICTTNASRKSMHTDQDLILPEALVELVDSPSENIGLDLDLSN